MNALFAACLLSLAAVDEPSCCDRLVAMAPEPASCTGSSPCRACSNCSRCAHCRSGGTCGVCAPASPSKGTEVPADPETARLDRERLEQEARDVRDYTHAQWLSE